MPVAAHVINGVSPVAIGVSGFAPASSSSATNRVLPFVHASDSEVTRKSFEMLVSAPRANQQSRRLDVVPVRRPQQGGRSVVCSSVDVDMLFEQPANRWLVLAPDRVDEAEIDRCR